MVSSFEDHLRARRAGGDVTVTFEDLERAAGTPLPPQAQHLDAWWSNLARQAGFASATVDRAARTATFHRATEMADEAVEYKGPEPEEKPPTRHPAWGAMKGLLTIKPGVDLTEPVYTDEEWAEIEKEMDEDWDQIMQGMSDEKK